MHARSGLLTEYLSEEWMQCIEVCAEEAQKLDMKAWFYDENGWPSGFFWATNPSISKRKHSPMII